MLSAFLTTHRADLIERCQAKASKRYQTVHAPGEVDHGIPPFLDQLIKTLEFEHLSRSHDAHKVSGTAVGDGSEVSELGATATLHGRDLSRRGVSVKEVVRDYGDLCQAITDLAVERNEAILVDEFRTLNRCLDNGIAVAVTEFTQQRRTLAAKEQKETLNERLGMFGHELRNLLNTATLAHMVIKLGDVSINGATGSVLDRSLVGMKNLIDRSLAEVRLAAGIALEPEVFSIAQLVSEAYLAAQLEAEVKGCGLAVAPVDEDLAVSADRDLILGAVGNLLQNAFKFTPPDTEVTLSAYALEDRVLIEVEDHGPGLPAGEADKMFLSFQQGGKNKSGLGLGLTISRRSVEASDGTLRARNKASGGCIFTIDLPRHHPQEKTPALAAAAQLAVA